MTATTAVEVHATQTTISQADADALQPGQPLGGGFYAGKIRQADGVHALIVAPKDGGEQYSVQWHTNFDRIDNARSFFDGRANTLAMAEAGSELAAWALGLQVNGFHDWYLPARDELELVYRNLKPTDEENYVYRSGDNPSSVPPGYPYTSESPAQTSAEPFQADCDEALDGDDWYWTSTQHEAYSDSAWIQGFGDGTQSYDRKDDAFRARAVRRLLIQ